METSRLRIAVNAGRGYIPGMNIVIRGIVLAASELQWDVVGIRDGFEGLLFPEKYSESGLIALTPESVENIDLSGNMLGTDVRNDPFHVRHINEDGMVEEIDKSDHLIEALKKNKINAVISVVGSQGLSILFKLHRKGLKSVCIPTSVDNDMMATALAFGFNSAVGVTTTMLESARNAARSAGRIGVVEVLGEHSGWLALQAAIAVCADAVLIPEIPYDLQKVAKKLQSRVKPGHGSHGLVVVAEGATPRNGAKLDHQSSDVHPLRASLSPLSNESEGAYVIEKSGRAANFVASQLQRLANTDTHSLVLGLWSRGGVPTAVDRQLGMAYGVAAVRAINTGQNGVMVSFNPPDLKFVPLIDSINKVRPVPTDSEFVQIARSLGICLGA